VRFASAQPSMNPSLPVGSAHCVLGPTCSRLLIIALFVVPLTLWPQLLNCELAIIGTSFPSIAIPCSRFSKLHSNHMFKLSARHGSSTKPLLPVPVPITRLR
jgi:hypothetical protein